jgi:hypothetical protein
MTGAEALLRHLATADDRPFAAAMACLPSAFRPGTAEELRLEVQVATTGPEPGNWLISVRDSICRVLVGSVLVPDARLFTDSEIGHSILTGRLTVDEALSSRLLDYDGDPAALRRFRTCFEFGDWP